MYSGFIKYKNTILNVSFKSKPSFQTIMFDKMGGRWFPLELIFKNKLERDVFIKNEPTSIVLEDIREDKLIQSWNICSIKQFTYKGNKVAVLHFNACFNEK